MYTTSWCGDCALARRFLKARGIDCREVDVDEDAEADRILVEWHGGVRAIPTFEFGAERLALSPFDRVKLGKWLLEVGAGGAGPISDAAPSDPRS